MAFNQRINSRWSLAGIARLPTISCGLLASKATGSNPRPPAWTCGILYWINYNNPTRVAHKGQPNALPELFGGVIEVPQGHERYWGTRHRHVG